MKLMKPQNQSLDLRDKQMQALANTFPIGPGSMLHNLCDSFDLLTEQSACEK